MERLKEFVKSYPMTATFLAISLFVFVLMQLFYPLAATQAGVIYQFGGMLGVAIAWDPSQLWRLVSPIFVHIGWSHLLFNGFSIYLIGRQVEALYGSVRFGLIYLLSGIMGNAFVMVWTPEVVSAGASTSLYGLFLLMALLRYRANHPYLQAVGNQFMGLLWMNLLLTFLVPDISLAGHLGGAVGGLLSAYLFTPQRIWGRRILPSHRRLAALIYVLLLLFGLWWTIR